MYKKIINWLFGYILIKIEGEQKDRFLNICSKNSIFLWNISKRNGDVYGCISLKKYKEATEYIEKTKVNISVEKNIGFPFLVKKYRKRYGFILGIFIYFLLIYGFTMFVWDINIMGEGIYTKEQIIKDLRDNYVYVFTPKKDIDCDELEKYLREKYSKVAWISCDIKGTSLNIHITETIDKNQVIRLDSPCNIVAIKDGIVTDIVVRKGKNIRNTGDEVKKGDVIITGTVNIYNDYDELLETNYVSADGDVYGIVSYDYYDEFDMNYYDKIYTGEDKKTYDFVFGSKHIPLGFKTNYDLYDQTIIEHKLVLGSSIYLPIYFNEIKTEEYYLESCVYSTEEAKEKARKRLQLYIDDLQKKGVEILENNVKISISNDKCYAKGTIVSKELIGVPQELTIINQGEEP